MAGLLPSTPDIDPSDEPRVVGLDSDDADELIDALSSSTTRAVLAALHEEPASASALAERVDTSLQNVQYHLRKLEDAGLVEVGDTVYSEKGREMNVYVPADRALVVVAGREEETTGLRAALSRLLGGVGVLGLASVVVDRLAREGLSFGFGATAGGGGDAADSGATAPTEAGDAGASGGAAAPTPEPATTPAATESATRTTVETAAETGGGFDIAEATTTTTAPAEATAVTDAAATMTATPAPTAMATETAAATPMAEPTATATPQATAVVAEATAETTTVVTTSASPGVFDGLAASPGLLFFFGGATVLLGGFALWWVQR